MDVDDGLVVTQQVWSQIGFLPGLVILVPSVIFFALLDLAIGNRFAEWWREMKTLHVVPDTHPNAPFERCAAELDGRGGDSGTSDHGQSGFAA